VRRLIINADDFGLTAGVNRAIADAARAGGITSATVMANSSALPDALSLARSTPQLKTGCHVVLIDGQPLTSNLPTLAPDGARFRSSLKDFAAAAVRGRIDAAEIEREAEAQIRKLQDAGLAITHIDSHKHTHMFPAVLRPLLRAARKCGVTAIRNPFEPGRCRPLTLSLGRPAMWARCAGVRTFSMFAAAFYKAISEAGVRTTHGTIGIAITGLLDHQALVSMLDCLPEGTWELVCHPGYNDADLARARTRLTASRDIELRALTSEPVRAAVARRGIELISYADL